MVPQCAMRVSRKQEIGPIEPYTPAEPCGCYYDKVANGQTTCATCNSDAECAATGGICRYHYCETP